MPTTETAPTKEGTWVPPEGPVTWHYVCTDPVLRELPYKLELDRFGRILMSPASTRHGRLQYLLARLLDDALEGGAAGVETAIRTVEGVRVPDVVWMSDAFISALPENDEVFETAPEVCVEVMSPSNPWAEMEEKVTLYLAKGAQEVWICEPDGRLRWFGHEGERERSALVPDAPAAVTL